MILNQLESFLCNDAQLERNFCSVRSASACCLVAYEKNQNPSRPSSGKIRDKHVADDEENYEGVPAWSALYPVTQVIGEPSDCARQLPGLTRPDDMADFVPGTRLDEVMTKTYKRTFGEG